jgi:MFS family permease
MFAAAVLSIRSIPETVTRDGGWRGSLVPRIAVPGEMRSAFIASIPSLVATWALGGLILSLGASLTAGALGQGSHLAGGLPIAIMAGVSAIMSVRFRHTKPLATARWGLPALITGVALALGALQLESNALFLAGAAIAGLGFGPTFAGVFRVLSELAPADQRGALVSSVFAVSYLAFSVPAVAAGAAVTDLGLRDTAEIYGVALIAVAAIALALSGGLREQAASTRPVEGRPRGSRAPRAWPS